MVNIETTISRARITEVKAFGGIVMTIKEKAKR